MNETTPWRKAKASGGNGGDCVEVRQHEGAVEIRHSHDPGGPVITYTKRELAAFLDGAKNGEFDDLAL